MKLNKNTLIVLVLFTFLVATLMGLEEFFEGELSGEGVVEEVLVYLIVLAILLFTIVAPLYRLINYFNENLPWPQFFFRRFFYEFLIVVLLSITVGGIAGNFIHHFIEHDLGSIATYIQSILFLFIITSLILAIIEFLMISEDRSRLQALNVALEKENVVSIYKVLKNQVNPHFLFNSLSILSSLIYFDVKKADQFIKEFSNIYRYVLELKDENLVTLKRELDFLDSYIFLQKIRFGKELVIDKTIPSEVLQRYLPPLSLQIVFENALKHNMVSKKMPLKINIIKEQDYIVVKNNYNPRNEVKNSSKIGQENLRERYRLLSDKLPVFELVGKEYVAKLPLLG